MYEIYNINISTHFQAILSIKMSLQFLLN